MKSLTVFIALLLFFAGVQAWIYFTEAEIGPRRQIGVAILAMAVVGALMFTRGRDTLGRAIEWLRKPSPIVRRSFACVLAVLGIAYLAETASSQERLQPVIHDEYCYVIQAQMYAKGRLWMPRHELAEFFDSFHLMTGRVYAAKYGPGTALFAAPVMAVGLPHWLAPLLLAGASIALLYLLLTEWIDGLAGLLGAVMLPSLTAFRRTSVEMLSQMPMLFLVLLALLALLYWKRTKRTRWLVIMSIAVGWSAITRPLDAVALALPLALAVLMELRPMDVRRRVRTIGIGLACVAPFLLLQLICAKAITGQFTRLPWSEYARLNDPYDAFLVGKTIGDFEKPGELPQKTDFRHEFTLAQYRAQKAISVPRRFLEHRLEPALVATVPHPLLYVLLPLGFWAGLVRGRWVGTLYLVAFLFLYTFYTFFVMHYATHYAVAIMPVAIMLLLAGLDRLAAAFAKGQTAIRAIGSAGILGLVVMSYPQLEASPHGDSWEQSGLLRLYDMKVNQIGKDGPAIVLFRYVAGTSTPHAEPVYNADVAWPDDARVIRAHDLGDRNVKLFKYYAAKEPQRDVYLYDRSKDGSDDALRYLGKVKDLANKQ